MAGVNDCLSAMSKVKYAEILIIQEGRGFTIQFLHIQSNNKNKEINKKEKKNLRKRATLSLYRIGNI